MWKLQSGVALLTAVIKSLESGELFRRFHLQNCQNVDEIDSAGDKLKFCLQQRHWSEKSSFIGTNDSSLFMWVLSYQVITFWTSPRVPGVPCEDKYFFTTGRWGTLPPRGPPLPCEQTLSYFVLQNWRESEQRQFHKLSDFEETALLSHLDSDTITMSAFCRSLLFHQKTNSWTEYFYCVIQYFHSVECKDLRPMYCKRIMWQKCFQIRYGSRLQRVCRKTCLLCWFGGRLLTHITTLQSEPFASSTQGSYHCVRAWTMMMMMTMMRLKLVQKHKVS